VVDQDRQYLSGITSRPEGPGSGFGMLKSRRKAVPADFDPATVLQK
jgi:hypothetical protein